MLSLGGGVPDLGDLSDFADLVTWREGGILLAWETDMIAYASLVGENTKWTSHLITHAI